MARALATKLFVIAAHPDDDVIGCGGTISHIARSGGTVSVAYLTDGSRSHPGSRSHSPEDIRDLREAEAIASLAVFGVTSQPTFCRLPDGALSTLSRDVWMHHGAQLGEPHRRLLARLDPRAVAARSAR